MSEANKATVRRMVEEIQNRHNLEAMAEFFTPDFINHAEVPNAAHSGNSIERAQHTFRALFSAFPDLQVTIQDQLAEGDKVTTRKRFEGTHQGLFMGVAPTGKRVAFGVIDILRLDQGKVVEHWAVQDRVALMQQLGLLPG